MRSPLPLLLAAAAGATTVEVRFTADFATAVTSTSSASCRGGAYRAHALTAAAGLRIDGGGVAAACGASTTCAQVFAAMGYDGWALNAADIASGSLQTFQGNVGSKPVASNYAQSYTSKFADVGGALLLAVAEGGTTTYRQAVDVALAEARDAGVDFGTTPVILCVSGMSSTDITDLGASDAVDAPKPRTVQHLRSIEEWDAAIASPTPILVDFAAAWCGPCQAIAPHFSRLAEHATALTLFRLDVDEVPEAQEAAGVTAMPTFQVYKEGKIADSTTGANVVKLEAMTKKAMA